MKFKIWPYEQMVHAQPSICPRELHAETFLELWHTSWSPNLGQKTRPYNNQQKKRTCKIVNFAMASVHGIKLWENEKNDKYQDHAWWLKKSGNMKVEILTVMTGAFGIVTETLLKGQEDLEISGWVKTIQITSFFRTARILRRVHEAVTQTPVKDY